MTQISRPQPEHQNNGYLDSGPYSADQWAELYKILFVGDNAADQGPLKNVLNELAVTNPSGSDIQVDTGWGVCNGHVLKNSAAVTFTPPNPSANPRIDVVVMVENNTAVARTAGIASSNPLVFPSSLTDYNSLSSLPPYTCRLAILRGTEAASPTAPTLDVDTATLFMVPLAQYQISTGGTISALTDRREFCSFASEVVNAMLGDDSVDDTKVGDRVAQFYRRQGGSSSNWSTGGSTTYTPTAVRVQMGAVGILSPATITFPVAFSDAPIVVASLGSDHDINMRVYSVTSSGFTVRTEGDAAATINWLAIGPE